MSMPESEMMLKLSYMELMKFRIEAINIHLLLEISFLAMLQNDGAYSTMMMSSAEVVYVSLGL